MQASMSSFSRYLSRNVLRRLAILGGAFILAACGGGGGDDGGAGGGGSGNGNLVINAGLDATVTEGVTYSLSAEVSGGDERLLRQHTLVSCSSHTQKVDIC